MIKYAFEELNLHSIETDIKKYNKPSKRIAEKNGFKKIVDFRETNYEKQEYIKTPKYQILKKDYKKQKS